MSGQCVVFQGDKRSWSQKHNAGPNDSTQVAVHCVPHDQITSGVRIQRISLGFENAGHDPRWRQRRAVVAIV